MTKRKLINDLSKELARLEGKKSQARIGDIREILSLLIKMFSQELVQKTYSISLQLQRKSEHKDKDILFVNLFNVIGEDAKKIDKKNEAKKK